MYNPMSSAELQKWTNKVNTTSSRAKVSIKSRFNGIYNQISFLLIFLFLIINWLEYLNDIYLVANITLPETEQPIAVETYSLKHIDQLLDNTATRVLGKRFWLVDKKFPLIKPLTFTDNNIHWRIVNNLAAYTNQRMADFQFEFAKSTKGVMKSALSFIN
jgi:endothelin-converting enzyme